MNPGWSRRIGYPLLGVLLACASTLGLLFAQALSIGRAPSLAFVEEQLRALPIVYLYTSGSLLFLFTLLGWIWGQRETQLQAGSLTDPLTGLWNRRQLANRMQEELVRALRHRTPLSFLLVDLDKLKQLNDRSGHQAGDDALRKVAEAIRGSCRRSDVPARYGGDEFAVLAPSTAGSDAAALGERIRSAVRATAREVALSVSIGVADLADLDEPSVERQNELCLAADRALYVAKQRGRDCVVCASEVVASALEEATT